MIRSFFPYATIVQIQKYKKHIVYMFLGMLTTFLAYGIFSPTAHLRMGNVFFGEVPSLYNIRFAEFFFNRATDPLIGNVPSFAYYQRSRIYFIQGNLGRSLKDAQKELELYPENKRTYYILGLTYGYLLEDEKAIEAFGKFIEWKPDTWAARNDRAWLQFRIGDIDGALHTMEPVVGQTGNPWVQNTYGTLLLNKERYIDAKQAFLYAKQAVDNMTEETWGSAYPGNDPRIYSTGLAAMRASIANNLRLIEGVETKVP